MYGYPNNYGQPFNAQQFNQNFDPTNNMYHQNYQQPVQQNYQKSQFMIRQVSNIEEAKSFIIDAFSTFLFVDYNNAKIYMKRMNNNGGSDFYTFTIQENQVQLDPLAEINKRLANIENKIGGNYELQSVSDDEKSNAGNATADDESNAKTESPGISKGSGNDSGKK